MKTKKIIIYSDGGAKGNPGPAGIGVVLYDADGYVKLKKSEYIGEQTNNQAEYNALILGLTEAKNLDASEVHCHLDSELVTRQMKGEYKVKNPNVVPLYKIASNIAKGFEKVLFFHVPREENKEADQLVNDAINEALKK